MVKTEQMVMKLQRSMSMLTKRILVCYISLVHHRHASRRRCPSAPPPCRSSIRVRAIECILSIPQDEEAIATGP